MFEFTLASWAGGNWRVEVQYITAAVRYDPQRLLQFSQNFVVDC